MKYIVSTLICIIWLGKSYPLTKANSTVISSMKPSQIRSSDLTVLSFVCLYHLLVPLFQTYFHPALYLVSHWQTLSQERVSFLKPRECDSFMFTFFSAPAVVVLNICWIEYPLEANFVWVFQQYDWICTHLPALLFDHLNTFMRELVKARGAVWGH